MALMPLPLHDIHAMMLMPFSLIFLIIYCRFRRHAAFSLIFFAAFSSMIAIIDYCLHFFFTFALISLRCCHAALRHDALLES